MKATLAACLAIFTVAGVPSHLSAAPDEPKPATPPVKRVAVLSSHPEPGPNTSQGLYIKILRNAGFEARALNAQEVRETKLEGYHIFIIGGGSGTGFNKSLGEDGCKIVREFIRKGGGALASCAGGYSFANGPNEALKSMTIAKADIIDNENGRWARGTGNVQIEPANGRYKPLIMFYANGPLWKIHADQGGDRTVALGVFRTEIKRTEEPGGVMPGTPAILAGTFGSGRFVLFSAHPEFHWNLGNAPLVADAASWVVKGALKTEEPIRWEDVFPASKLSE